MNINHFEDARLRLGEYHPNINGYRKIADIIYEKIKNKL
jgi:lysophospholipase L1-like esterase